MGLKQIGSGLLLISLIGLAYPVAPARAQADATPEAAVTDTDCEAQTASSTPTVEALSTAEPTAEATLIAAQSADAPLRFVSFLPTDVKFNPDDQNPVVVIMIFSLIFQNQHDQTLELRAPKFQLAIDGVSWGDVASTDFQMGQLLANTKQGIVLQSLTFAARTTDAQKAVLKCIAKGQPVDLTLTGTIHATLDGAEQTVEVDLTSPHVVIQPRKPQS